MGADPGDWYVDHLNGRCGCTDDRAFCETGRALWKIAVYARNPRVAVVKPRPN